MGEVGWGLQIGIYQDFLLIIITLTQEDDLVVVIHVCISSVALGSVATTTHSEIKKYKIIYGVF